MFQPRIELLVPTSTSLLKTIECLMQSGHLPLIRTISDLRRQVHVDDLVETTVQESSRNIKRLDLVIHGGSDGQDLTEGLAVSDRREGVREVDARTLREAFRDQTCLEDMVGASSRVNLDGMDQSGVDGLDAGRDAGAVDQSPRACLLDAVELFL